MRSNYIQAVVGLAVLLVTTFSAIAAIMRDNFLNFAIPGVTIFSYTANPSFPKATKGQPVSPLAVPSGIGKTGETGFLDIKAGRKGSQDMANQFKQLLGPNGQALACDAVSGLPDELNFIADGTLSFTVSGVGAVVCRNVVIGQGHVLTVNNWWIGGPGMGGVRFGPLGEITQTCTVAGKPAAVTFFLTAPCANQFNVKFP